ncbi:MAG: hypothetical protein FWE25_10700 [Lachnospiraceae bacterium]|nr:hypothetical protein [Lachnospiraceae bacterium]
MKKMTFKIQTIISSNRGETIVETVVALVICLVLLAGITSMVTTALRVTGLATADANEKQEEINRITFGTYAGERDVAVERFVIQSLDATIYAVHDVYLLEQDGIITFTPKVEVEP